MHHDLANKLQLLVSTVCIKSTQASCCFSSGLALSLLLYLLLLLLLLHYCRPWLP
jgi:hypothetical protein